MLRGIPCPHAICAYYYLNQDPDQHVEHWYRKETFLKAYSHFIQPIPNMRMWPKTTNPSIEPPNPRKMPGRPKKNRRKRKDEPKKFGKISKKGVKMSCSTCKSYGHNKAACATRSNMGGPSSQASSICGDTTAPPKDTQTRVYENLYTSSQRTSICSDTTAVPRAPQKEVQVGLGRGLGRKKANARGTPFLSAAGNSCSQVPPKSSHKRSYNSALFAAATGRNKRPTSGFGVYSDATTGTQLFNPGTSSEMILQGPTNLKSASPTNIDIGFKPRGLKWNGKDAVSSSQLQQMRPNTKKKVASTCETSKT